MQTASHADVVETHFLPAEIQRRAKLRRSDFMMLSLYRLLILPAMVFAAPYYLLRMRRRGGYARHFGDRWGAFYRVPLRRPGVARIWLQAVSVGEMLAIAPILEALAARPDLEIVLTTTTSTGFALAEERYASRVVALGYFPLDVWPFSRRAWRMIQPDLVILTEGELWPEHLAQARARNVPVVCINARLSDRSFGRMQRAKPLVRRLLAGITRILASSEHDAERFRRLGFPPERVSVTGNVKVDVSFAPVTDAESKALKLTLGFRETDSILLGSSTWPGEELALIQALRALREAGVMARLLLVPRHAERRTEIEAALKQSGFSFHVRSRGPAPAEVDVCLADTTGELRKLTQLADVVFVGKSLAPHHEGQTPIEAAALGKPLLFGPEMSNFRSIASELVQSGAARVVHSSTDLAAETRRLFEEPNTRAAMSIAAGTWHRASQGAVERTLTALDAELAHVTVPNR